MTEFSRAFVSFVAFLLIRTIPYWERRIRDLVTYMVAFKASWRPSQEKCYDDTQQ
jgi:hypothetical protein